MFSEECADDSGFDITAAWQKQCEEPLDRFEAITTIVWVWGERWSDVQEWALRATTTDVEGEPPGDDGWTCLQLEFMNHLHVMTILLRFGSDACVITPKCLRQDLLDHVDLMRERYYADGI